MNTSQILNHTADLLNTATTTLLAHPKALDRAPELMELHLAEGKVRAAVTDQPTEEPPTDIEAGPAQTDPSALLAEAARLLDTLPAQTSAPLSESRRQIQNAQAWVGELA